MGNYIHRLQDDLAGERAYVHGLEQGLGELRRYLCSSKFHDDTTVQVTDILRRVEETYDFANQVQERVDAQNRDYRKSQEESK